MSSTKPVVPPISAMLGVPGAGRSAASPPPVAAPDYRPSRNAPSTDAFGDEIDPLAVPPPMVVATSVSSAPPPEEGRRAIVTFSDFAKIQISDCFEQPDQENKTITWYEVTVASPGHRWVILKRFSEIYDFHSSLQKALKSASKALVADNGMAAGGHGGAASSSGPLFALPEFPSRMHIGAKDAQFKLRRRQQLEEYLQSLLNHLQEAEAMLRLPVSRQMRGGAAVQAADAQMAALLVIVRAFLKTSSVSGIMSGVVCHHSTPIDAPILALRQDGDGNLGSGRRHHPAGGQRATASARGNDSGALPALDAHGRPVDPLLSDAGSDRSDNPGVRLVLRPDEAFIAMLHVPGMPLKHLYVVPNEHQPRYVIVGGKWATAMCVPPEVLVAINAARGKDAASEADRPNGGRDSPARSEVLYDTFPLGEFEVTFEVPPPFDPLQWFTEYHDGVLSVIWITPS